MTSTAGELDLGGPPLGLRFTLIRDSDFVLVIDPLNDDDTDGAFAAGTQIALVFDDATDTTPATVWAAVVTPGAGGGALFNVDKVDVNALITRLGARRRCTLRYQQGSVDRVWARGNLTVNE